jgi:hypothetical protein
VPGSALPSGDADAGVELARRLAAGTITRRLPGNGEGPRDTAMTMLPKMSCEATSRHLREALA